MSQSIPLCLKKNSKYYLCLVSFIESIFFPIPTDIFLFPYILAKKDDEGIAKQPNQMLFQSRPVINP